MNRSHADRLGWGGAGGLYDVLGLGEDVVKAGGRLRGWGVRKREVGRRGTSLIVYVGERGGQAAPGAIRADGQFWQAQANE